MGNHVSANECDSGKELSLLAKVSLYTAHALVGPNQYLHGGKTQHNCQKYHITTSTLGQIHFFLIFPGQHLNTTFKYRIKCNTANIEQTMAK
jgi:hypothetical protein